MTRSATCASRSPARVLRMRSALVALVLAPFVSGCSHAKPVLELTSPDALAVAAFGAALGQQFQDNEQLPPNLRQPEAGDQVTQASLNYYADQAGFQRPYPGPDLLDYLKGSQLRFEHVKMVVSAVETAIHVAKLVGPLLQIYAELLLTIPRILIGIK